MSRRRLTLFAAIALALILVGVGWRGRQAFTARAHAPKQGQPRTASLDPSGRPPALARSEETAAPRLATARIRGRVLAAGGGAIAGATVCAQGTHEAYSDDELGRPVCTTSAADGEYELASLYAAFWDVDASAPHHQPGRYRAEKRETLRLGPGEERSGIDLVLRKGGVEVRGRVKDIGGGGVAGARVRVSRSGIGRWDEGSAYTVADERGDWRAFVAPGAIDAYAEAAGYADGWKAATAPGNIVEILLTPEAVLVGRVVRAGSDEPVPGALVDAGPVDMSEWMSERSATSGPDGRFKIVGLAPGRYKPTASTETSKGRAANSVLLGVAGHSPEVIVEVHPAASISGQVLLADGKTPCDKGFVTLEDKRASRSAWGRLDRNGRVLLRAVLPGKYDVSISCEGEPVALKEPLTVADKSLGGLHWVLTGTKQTVAGRVERASGEPVAGAFVTLGTRGGDPRAQQHWLDGETREDGTFRIPGVPPGDYHLRVQAAELPALREPVAVTVPAGRDVDNLRIVLERDGGIDGVVKDQDGRAVAGARITVDGPAELQHDEARSRDDGTFSLRGLHAGEYRVQASRGSKWLLAPGGHDDDVQGAKARVVAGQVSHVRLIVQRETGVIKGQVRQGSTPVTDAFVDAERESDSATEAEGNTRRNMRHAWYRQPALTDGEGRFEIKDLAPGRYSVRAFRKGGGEAVAEHVAIGASVTLVITPTGTISGTVSLGAGGPAPEAFTVSLADTKEGYSREERFWRTAGRFAMNDLPKGEFQLQVEAAEGTVRTAISLREGEERPGVALVLAPKVKVRGQVLALDSGKPVPGMVVSVVPTGQRRILYTSGEETDRRHITDAQGQFEIDDAPAGRVNVMAFSQDWEDNEYGWGFARAVLEAGEVNQLAPLRCPRRRVKPPARAGDLGFYLKDEPPDPNDSPRIHTVAVVRAGGPAARAGLKIGDVIVAVDGQDVTGQHDHLFGSLTEVPPGAVLKLALAKGGPVTITADPPP